MKYLALNDYQVIAMRDLAKYVNANTAPDDAQEIIQERQAALAETESK